MKRTKAVALIMMLVLFMVMMPQALWISAAEELREIDITIPTVSTEVSTAEEEPYILYEDENKRTENEKHFVMSDGTMMMEQYQEAIHYRDTDGKFREIDNTFEEKVEDGIAYYGNRANKFEALFNRTMQDGDLMKMRQGQYELSFDFLGREYQTGFEELFEQASEVIARVDRDYLNQTKSKIDYRAKKLTKAAEPSNLSSLLRYQNMIPGVDIEYKVLPNGVKENIILSKRLSSYDFRFALKTENLILELMPTGEIYAWPSDTDEEGSQPVYVIPAPYMADQAGAVSTDIRYELIEQAGGYLLKLIADEDWLNAAERSYPVVLDPIIETSSAFLNNTKYAIVYEKGKATETSVSEYVMAGIDNDDSTKGRFSSYIRLGFTTYLANYYQIISGTFTYHRGNANSWWGGMGYDVVVSEPVGDMTKLTWSNKPQTLQKIEDGHIGFLGGDTSNTLEFNTNFIFNNSITFGFIFDDTNLARNWVKIYVHNSSKPLSLSLKYKYRTGLNEDAKYEKISLEGATAYVDTFNRRLSASFDILGTNCGVLPLQLTGVYNTEYDTLVAGYGLTPALGRAGRNIKLNFDQFFIVDYDVNKQIYIDQDGSINVFTKNNANLFYSENGLQLIEGTMRNDIYDKHGNYIDFFDGRPVKICDIYGNELTFSYNRGGNPMIGDLLVKVSNNKGQYIEINYNSDNYISSVVNNYGETRSFEYDSDHNLVAIKDGMEKVFEFGYDSNGYLNRIIDRYRQGISIQYSGNAVTTVNMTNGSKANSVVSNDKIEFYSLFV